MTDSIEQIQAAPRSRMIWPLLGCLAVSIGSFFLYGALMGVPSIRSTAWPVFVLMGLAAVASIYLAARGRGWFGKILAGFNVALPVLFSVAFFRLAALPQATALASDRAPEFTLPDQNEKPVALAETLAQGPVLLVFYRGHW